MRGEYGDFDGGLCTPTWDLWGHPMVRHRERIERIVAGADDPAEALWRDPEVRSAAHDVALARLDGNAEVSELMSAVEELVEDGPLYAAVSDEGTRRHVAACPRGSITGPSGWIHSW